MLHEAASKPSSALARLRKAEARRLKALRDRSQNLQSAGRRSYERNYVNCHQSPKDCHALMEIDWEVSNDTVVRPDLLIACGELGERIIRTPSLIAEMVSGTSTLRDEKLKFDLYEKEGVSCCLLVYPEKRLAKVYRNESGHFMKLADVTKGEMGFELDSCRFSIDFATVWRRGS